MNFLLSIINCLYLRKLNSLFYDLEVIIVFVIECSSWKQRFLLF